MTRAKAAALDVDVLAQPAKQPLQAKKSAVNANTTATRKRAALGDVSNVGKADAVEGKKTAAGKAGLVSKAAQPTGIHKSQARTASTRAALAPKETKKTEVKRSGPGAIGASQKRKVTASATTVKQDVVVEEEEPVRKKVHTAENEQNKPQQDKQELKKQELKKQERAEPKTSKVSKVSKTSKVVEAPVEPASPEPAEEEPEPELLAPELVQHVYPEGVKDLDSEDLDDPLMAAEYANEIFEYMRDLEVASVPNPNYMQHQDDLEWKTRGILIDWLIEVHTRFHLLPETLFLAINIIDRFLSEKVVQLDRLQLVGITAMFIACKYEEVLSPHVGNFVHIADDGFTEDEILSAERFVLTVLNYDLSYPNPMNFLRRISKADNYDIQSRTIGKYLMEISLLDHRFMKYRPSHVAAAAMFLARLILDRGDWDLTIAYYAGYTEEEIEPVADLMVDYLARPVIHEAFYKKYASKKFMKASLLTRSWAKRSAAMFGVKNPHLSLDDIS
ncbi:cyclin-like protein [Xylariomycetidae sp. FL0641]|nr:cyclin-like protein [Xylariomycetidae sp. FL0641]